MRPESLVWVRVLLGRVGCRVGRVGSSLASRSSWLAFSCPVGVASRLAALFPVCGGSRLFSVSSGRVWAAPLG
ncbi:MAG: hypothetical protein HC866_21200 [Leptolyngbyaceae cyanobacterium RU_5_1]|nr:hypothetical protein [Leptolyngbyaceae cyanobacterium RU_5_1]